MKFLTALKGGIAGSLVVNLLHETIRRINPDAPRIDILGMDALSKTLDSVGIDIPSENELYKETLAAGLVSNAFYYSLIGTGSKKQVWSRGIILGLLAGFGGVYTPKPLGLKSKPTNKTNETKLLTIAYYTLGGIAAAAVINASRKK